MSMPTFKDCVTDVFIYIYIHLYIYENIVTYMYVCILVY